MIARRARHVGGTRHAIPPAADRPAQGRTVSESASEVRSAPAWNHANWKCQVVPIANGLVPPSGSAAAARPDASVVVAGPTRRSGARTQSSVCGACSFRRGIFV